MSNYLTHSKDNLVKFMMQEGLSKSTIEQYIGYIDKLALVDTRLYRLTNSQIQDFILESNSESGQNCKINAIKKYFYVNHPNKRIKVFIRPKPKKTMKQILSVREVWRLIDAIPNIKQKAIVSGIYLHGLRISEILKVKYSNINREDGVLYIEQSKGKKDRKAPLNKRWLDILTPYTLSQNHRKGYDKPIFQPYSESSIRTILNSKAIIAGITKNIYPHLLRDSYATHLNEQGYDISVIQEILGHEKIETTRKYIHLSTSYIASVELQYN